MPAQPAFTLDARFVELPGGRRFCLTTSPAAGRDVRGVVIHAHALAEEMNKSRRMCALLARALAGDGFRVVQLDLQGCGDSDGDFSEATWHGWQADLLAVAERESRALAGGRVWLWGMRAGALLLPHVLSHIDVDVLLWQPVLAGRQHLQQFLRLLSAGALIGGGGSVDRKAVMAGLEAGTAIDVAGYTLTPALALGLDAARLDLPAGFRGRVAWLEVSADQVTAGQPSALLPPSQQRAGEWAARGVDVRADAIAGLQFWQTTEIAEVPALIERTRELMRGSS
jgi:uncharacterized protein